MLEITILKRYTVMTKPTTTLYENNPLFIATKGLELLFAKAISVAVMLLIFVGLSLFTGLPSRFTYSSKSETTNADMQQTFNNIQSVDPAVWVVIGAFALMALLAGFFIQVIFNGISDYTAAQLARNKNVTLSEALGAVFSHFWGYSWVVIIVAVKTFLWTLLFIIPGFIMTVRYSLSGVSYFDKQLSGNNAVKHSLALTKGAWLTTFAGHALLPMLTFGALGNLTVPGSSAVLYRQYSAADGPKPPAHIVSWLTLIIPIVFLLAVFSIVIVAVLLLVNFNAPLLTHG